MKNKFTICRVDIYKPKKGDKLFCEIIDNKNVAIKYYHRNGNTSSNIIDTELQYKIANEEIKFNQGMQNIYYNWAYDFKKLFDSKYSNNNIKMIFLYLKEILFNKKQKSSKKLNLTFLENGK